MKMKLKLNEIKFVEGLYPRNAFNNEIVNNYRLNIDELPSILVQKEEKILIDGYHRLIAHRIEGRDEINVEFLDIPKEQILWEATRRNALHGLQLSRGEKKSLARKFYKQEKKLSEIAEVLAIAESTLSNWLKDLIQEAREEQKQQIIQLYLQCKQQNEIAKELELTEGRVSQILNKFKTEEIKEISLVPESLQVFNVWSFQRRDSRYGLEGIKGQICGQIVENFLHYFTKPFDVVVDPMAGGGTIIDVCKSMYRRWQAYDITPLRDDIKKNNIKNGFPNQSNNCNAVFLDPPYFDIMEGNPFKTLEEFYSFMHILAIESKKIVKKGGYIGLLMCDRTKQTFECLTGECYKIFTDIGLKCIHRISVPLTTQSASGDEVSKAKKLRKMLGRDRVLYIFKK